VHHVGSFLYGQFMMHGQRNIKMCWTFHGEAEQWACRRATIPTCSI